MARSPLLLRSQNRPQRMCDACEGRFVDGLAKEQSVEVVQTNRRRTARVTETRQPDGGRVRAQVLLFLALSQSIKQCCSEAVHSIIPADRSCGVTREAPDRGYKYSPRYSTDRLDAHLFNCYPGFSADEPHPCRGDFLRAWQRYLPSRRPLLPRRTRSLLIKPRHGTETSTISPESAVSSHRRAKLSARAHTIIKP